MLNIAAAGFFLRTEPAMRPALIMSTRPQIHSTDQGRDMDLSSQPPRLLSRIRTNPRFVDADYNQPSPELKTTSAISPTSTEVRLPTGSRLCGTVNHASMSPVLRPHVKSVGFVLPTTTSRALDSTSDTGNFQDQIARPNLQRAHAMITSSSTRRAITPRLTRRRNLVRQDSKVWGKARPDTPINTRFESKSRVFDVLRRKFVWIIMALVILIGLTSSGPKHVPQHTHETLSDYMGNASEDLSLTFDQVGHSCHVATDEVSEKLDTTSAESNIENVLSSSSTADSHASDEFGTIESAREGLEKAMYKLPGPQDVVECTTLPERPTS
jgi:hypothetical protein